MKIIALSLFCILVIGAAAQKSTPDIKQDIISSIDKKQALYKKVALDIWNFPGALTTKIQQ